MKFQDRYLKKVIAEDLKSKMVFIGGPRQVGKTTFALNFLKKANESHPAYLNWDDSKMRRSIISGELPPDQNLIIFDEIHKFARWRNLVKGLYDTHKSSVSFLITGSARLDYYSKGGDSLHGRYHYYRLHPFSLCEINSTPTKNDMRDLLEWGGFPEPFLAGNRRFLRRWQRERLQRVLYEDIRDLEHVREISLLELLLDELPHRVGSPLSIKKLREILQVSHESIERWISIFERLYICFRVSPYGSRKIRAVKKEQKLYFWDWSYVPEIGERFENLVACQLLKYCHYQEDTEGYTMELRYIRDTDKREVDFVVLRDRQPLFAVECKSGDKQIGTSIKYFRERTPIPEFYQVHLSDKDYGNSKTQARVLPFYRFCKDMQLP